MASSRYLTRVLRIVKRAFPEAAVRKEQNLFELIKTTHISEELKTLCQQAKTNFSLLRVDLYLVGQCAIEVHGEQHVQTIRFSNEILDLEAELKRRQLLDDIKQRALKAAGIPTIVIWFHEIDTLTTEELRCRVALAISEAQEVPLQQIGGHRHPPQFRTRSDAYRARRLAKAKELRRERYRRSKTLAAAKKLKYKPRRGQRTYLPGWSQVGP